MSFFLLLLPATNNCIHSLLSFHLGGSGGLLLFKVMFDRGRVQQGGTVGFQSSSSLSISSLSISLGQDRTSQGGGGVGQTSRFVFFLPHTQHSLLNWTGDPFFLSGLGLPGQQSVEALTAVRTYYYHLHIPLGCVKRMDGLEVSPFFYLHLLYTCITQRSVTLRFYACTREGGGGGALVPVLYILC